MVVAPESLEGLTVAVEDEITLGRAAGCGITVDDGHVSPLHARLFRAGGHLVVEDLGSTNGTYVNRERVESPTALGSGDHLQVGDIVLELW
ncbi:MAG: FHA domain-containing protein [Acidimicrobiales bacterium]|jgi:pSer/pThr/pTyr-binding forkhead associated (FHA) protein|nr:FHA domain-containing protein [Acidimicrobiales bacterium]|tara:strand:+ start:6569 stop:6841 length:273 start_codon:yes stop_codon:yes gene_type:complete